MANSSPCDLHIFFLPFLAPGHMIPMVDLAKMFAARGVKSSIVTTPSNAPRIEPTIEHLSTSIIQLLILDVPPSPFENLTALPTPEITPDVVAFTDTLKDPFVALLDRHRPDCIVSDLFLPWSALLGVKRLLFTGLSSFCSVVQPIVSQLKLDDHDGSEPFLIPGIPHRIEMCKSELVAGGPNFTHILLRIIEATPHTYGMLVNSFYELEADYANMMHYKSWHLGPVSLFDRGNELRRGGPPSASGDECSELCLNWLDGKKRGSVLYVCFGSLGRFTRPQLREIAVGLESSGHDFIWVIKNCGDKAEWMPEGFEERVVGGGKGLIVTGWAPQLLILDHPAVGGFVTHCGWNSCLEGATAGLPMITWPLFNDQFLNEKLLVHVLRIGVSVGAKVSSLSEEKRTLVKGVEVEKAVKELMGSAKEAEERRNRAKEIAGMAKKAVEEGGSSYNDLTKLIQELKDAKACKPEGENIAN